MIKKSHECNVLKNSENRRYKIIKEHLSQQTKSNYTKQKKLSKQKKNDTISLKKTALIRFQSMLKTCDTNNARAVNSCNLFKAATIF